MLKTDYLIIGSGIAGLFLASKLTERFPDRSICILSKRGINNTNTSLAQGGIACVIDYLNDSKDKHINDTLIAGDGICDREVVKMVIQEAPGIIKDLIEKGVAFDKASEKEFSLAKEGGHSAHRILHHKDTTGLEIQNKLLKWLEQKKNIKFLPFHQTIDLSIHLNKCIGVQVAEIEGDNIKKIYSIAAAETILASGGAGQVYMYTTNPEIATGDGIAMAIRAKAVVKDLEFVQFHPTALYEADQRNLFLISEAVRGMGAKLLNCQEISFMKNYDTRAELAPRDIVSRAIEAEIKKSSFPYVWMDCSPIPEDIFKCKFPNIYNKCMERGIDPTREKIPVVPAAHYICGGVKVDKWGKTSIPSLYAIGETACTGLHGANRLASNSLLEAAVYANNVFEDLKEKALKRPTCLPIKSYNIKKDISDNQLYAVSFKIKEIMNENGGITRTEQGLRKAVFELRKCKNDLRKILMEGICISSLEAYNIAVVAEAIIKAAMKRSENKGTHFKLNHVELVI